MSYPLRLSPELDAEARERCRRLGVSLNAFIAMALDAYLRGSPARGGGGKRAAPKTRPARPAAAGSDQRGDWRTFHPDPDMWPYVDPEFAHRFEGIADDDEASSIALEAEYWQTRERPARKG